MRLPKSLTTVTRFSKILAMILFILFPILGFKLGMDYQKKFIDAVQKNKNENSQPIEKNISPTPKLVSSPNKIGWYRYISDNYDYYIDYPNNYIYHKDYDDSKTPKIIDVYFEKLVNYPHAVNPILNIQSSNDQYYDKKFVENMKNMSIGETKTPNIDKCQLETVNKESCMSFLGTYERLSDVNIGNKRLMSFIDRKLHGDDKRSEYYYIYEGNNVDYTIIGDTNESTDSPENMPSAEFKEIISTIRFLD